MVGLVVATHGRLAEEMLATAEQIVGKLDRASPVSIQPGSSPTEIRSHVEKVVHEVNDGHGVLVLVDLFGGTPCKESLRLCTQEHVEVLCGVNLPMLLKASSLRSEEMSLDEMAHQLASYGQRNITCASDLLRQLSPPAPQNH